MAYYVFDENNNKIEVTDKVLTALVEQIRCCVSGTYFKEAFVTQAKYNELVANGLLVENCIYNISDDTTCEDIDASLKEIKDDLRELNNQDIVNRVATLESKVRTTEYNIESIRNEKVLYKHIVKLYKQGATNSEGKYEIYVTIFKNNNNAINSASDLKTALDECGQVSAYGYHTYTPSTTSVTSRCIAVKYIRKIVTLVWEEYLTESEITDLDTWTITSQEVIKII